MYYLDKNTITQAYNSLSSTVNKNVSANTIFQLLILKYSGISDKDEIDTTDSETKKLFVEATTNLGYLYCSEDYKNQEYNFINPFNMSEWGQNSKESLVKWSTTRLSNNVAGGGRNWRNIVQNAHMKPDVIKLFPSYLDYIEVENQIPLTAIAIWLYRFTPFESKPSIDSLKKSFLKMFNISDAEKYKLFTYERLNISFSNECIDSILIRKLINGGNKNPVWQDVKIENNKNLGGFKLMETYEYVHYYESKLESKEKYKELLDDVNQLIIKGPPGSSKSFTANEIARIYYPDNYYKIQFHPQYTYQQFIGGELLKDNNMIYQKGILLKIIDEAKDKPNDEFLLIIEEINRANVGQVFGEAIQLLDRGEKVKIEIGRDESGNRILEDYSMPSNLKIIGTMNSTDRTLRKLDFALKRRFYEIYSGVDYSLLDKLVELETSEFSLTKFLETLNSRLVNTLKDSEAVVGHALFFKDFVRTDDGKYIWNIERFKDLFNYSILPLVEDYCNNDLNIIESVLGSKLVYRILDKVDFVDAVSEWL